MRWIGIGCLAAAWFAAHVPVADGAQVTITSSASVVAQGGSATFTVAVVPDTYVQRVTLTVAGQAGQHEATAAPYVFAPTFTHAADGVIVTAIVDYSNSDPSDQAGTSIDVVGLTISGSASPTRGMMVGYTAQSNPVGKPVSQFNWSYRSATFLDNDTDGNGKSTWAGRMVDSGTLTCDAVVSGVPVTQALPVAVTARNWVTPITCAQDNDSGWGEIPTPGAALGQNRDRDSDAPGHFFVPRSGNSFVSAITSMQVTSGPCTGIWYVYATTLKCERETVINRYIKSTGDEIDGLSFWGANTYCFDPGTFLQAVKNHEYRGTPETYKGLGGHQGRTEKRILDEGWDPRKGIEGITGSTKAGLETAIDSTVSAIEVNVANFALNEFDLAQRSENWGGPSSPGEGPNSRWDGYWTDCENAPLGF